MRWIIRRIILAFLTVYIVITITFFLVRLMPGNIIDMLLLEYQRMGVPRELALAEIAALYNINLSEPIWMQYIRYVGSLLRGDLGLCYISRVPVADALLHALPWTVFLLSISITISFVIGVVLGMLMAYKRGGILDNALSTFASISYAIPNYILGLLLLYFFAIYYPIFPARGAYDINIAPGFTLEFISSVLHHSILPMLAYILTSVGGWMLAMRSSTVRVLGEDYVVAAEARGLKTSRIVTTYVGRNAIIPLFTSFAISLGYMFGGSVFIETYFSYPGIGQILGLAMSYRDYPLIQGGVLLITSAVVISNLIADLLYAKLDPRIRMGGR